MYGVSKRVENSCHLIVNCFVVSPDVSHWKGYALGEGPGTCYADAGGVIAEMPSSRHAVAAPSTHHMALAADEFAHSKIRYAGSDLYHFSYELVSHH